MLYKSLILTLFHSGEYQLVDKLIKLVALKIRDRGVLDSDINSLHAFVHRCSSRLKLNSTDLEDLARPLANRHPLGKAILARVLFDLRRTDESKQLFLEHLSNLPPGTPEAHAVVADACHHLSILYYQEGNPERGEHYLGRTL